MSGSLTIGEVASRSGVAATTLRYYEQVGLLAPPRRVGGQRRYDPAVLARLEILGLCKSAGFALAEIRLLFGDDAPGRPVTRALARAKLAEIDAQLEALERARGVIEWGMRCTCPSIDACSCGVHPPPSLGVR
ncbi:MerR family transcriptional regulator [Mycolicibacter senuensis]|uniref:MerR family transcriptional regulator n=1 Tax=Mycolicibacter senuensis TaxID=386913 RepID=A0A7I9XHY9_9MYCO|nr:MerR family transcriptional regulator [Mycolicibacter senuensis]MDQ2627971.1 MerR family transcriptional regulator [Actinomycetota bacterium]ORW66985.1 MerR family transcriptional regulator [Mycolicibacter senuensis]GFG69388.1 MerR family transcriptional regulator [Mycolicibacter senuensis]